MFRLKKTSHSRRMAKMVERERRKEERERKLQESSDEGSEDEGPTVSLSHRLSEGFIPDAATIHAARKKREMARKLGSQPAEFLSLNSNGAERTVKGKSRLIREDDNDKSDSDQEPAMSFGGRGQATRQMRVLTALENVGIEEEDEETSRWVEEQINKGAKLSIPTSQPSATVAPPSIDQSFLYGSMMYVGGDPVTCSQSETSYKHISKATPIPDRLVPVTVDSLKSRLQTRLRDLKEAHSGHAQKLRQVEGDLDFSVEEVERLELRAGDVSHGYKFYQEMRGYVRDLLSCLTEKVELIFCNYSLQ